MLQVDVSPPGVLPHFYPINPNIYNNYIEKQDERQLALSQICNNLQPKHNIPAMQV
jgi:hypothetical protein